MASRIRVITGHLSAASGITQPGPASRGISSAAQAVLSTRLRVNVLDSYMSYLDTSGGPRTVVFLHGNPTSAFLWRDIIPHVKGVARCLAPDLIGMGHSGKTASYKFSDHYRYLCAWMEAVKLPEKFTLVCHDWGSALAFHWTAQHPKRVEALVHMESVVAAVKSWDHFPEVARNMFQAMRSPAGEELVLKKNIFVERLLPGAIMRKLTEDEMREYLAPFKEPGEDRRPTLTWPREIPVRSDGPANVVEIVDKYGEFFLKSADLPKLYIDAQPGFFSPFIRKLCAKWPNQKTVEVKGLHFVQEDSPNEIGKAIHDFLVQDVYSK